METHRVLHDFGELSYEDLEEISGARQDLPSRFRGKPYQFILAALAMGLLIGYLAKRD